MMIITIYTLRKLRFFCAYFIFQKMMHRFNYLLIDFGKIKVFYWIDILNNS